MPHQSQPPPHIPSTRHPCQLPHQSGNSQQLHSPIPVTVGFEKHHCPPDSHHCPYWVFLHHVASRLKRAIWLQLRVDVLQCRRAIQRRAKFACDLVWSLLHPDISCIHIFLHSSGHTPGFLSAASWRAAFNVRYPAYGGDPLLISSVQWAISLCNFSG